MAEGVVGRPRAARKSVRKAPPAEARALRGLVPACTAAQAQALRGLFDAPRRWQARGGTLRFSPGVAPAPGETFAVDAEGTRLLLRLESDAAALAQASGLHWSDHRGRARLLAWSLAHESVLMALSEALGAPLLPLEPAATDAEPAGDALWLAFAGVPGPGEDGVPLRGALRLPVDWLARLRDRAEPPGEDAPAPVPAALQGVPLPVFVGFDGPALPLAQWQALRPGDVLVVGNAGAPPLQARAARQAWPLAPAPDGWRIAAAAQVLPSLLEPSSMNDATPNPLPGEDAVEPAAPRDLPVQLGFDIGRIEIGIGELAALQPGYVFALPAHLEGANVTIRANGRVAGRGEVVAVGETLGVRLLAWE